MIHGAPSAFLKPRRCNGMAVVERSHPHRRRRRRGRGPLWELAISQGDGFASVGDPGCRGCVPSLSVRDVCMRSRPVAIATHTYTDAHTYSYGSTRGPQVANSSASCLAISLWIYESNWRSYMAVRTRGGSYVCERRRSSGFHPPRYCTNTARICITLLLDGMMGHQSAEVETFGNFICTARYVRSKSTRLYVCHLHACMTLCIAVYVDFL